MREDLKRILEGMTPEQIIELLGPYMSDATQRNCVIKYEFIRRKRQNPERSERDIMLDLSVEYERAANVNADHSGLSVRMVHHIIFEK